MRRRFATAVFSLILLAPSGCAPESRSTASPASKTAETPTPPPAATLPVATAKGPLRIVPPAATTVGRNQKVELEIESDVVPANPFDPDEFDLRLVFTSPGGVQTEIGAFWYQEYDATGWRRVGPPGWRARFTPTELGSWTAVARVPARHLESAPVAFDVIESGDSGFVRLHPSNPRYLAFDDETFLFPIGLNLGWWPATGDALVDYSRWMGRFASSGGNTIRVWMAEWSFGIEWDDTPLGDYSNRMRRAWLLDQIFRWAEGQDLYVLLVLLNCADFNDWQTDGWRHNPYNTVRGGMLDRPEDFVSDPEARALLRRRLNYIVNRWGYSPHLLAWEWWNEVNLTPIPDEALIPWLQEMTAYLQEHDVNHHLTTNSYAIRYLSPIWQMPELDLIQRHEYATQVRSPERDLAGRVEVELREIAQTAPAKPILLGEFGYGGEDSFAAPPGRLNPGAAEKTGIHLHNGLWATTFAGYAGSAMYWFWDVYIEANHLWHHFSALDRFLEGVDLSEYEPFRPAGIGRSATGEGRGIDVVGLGLRGDDVLLWFRSDAYTVDAATEARLEAGSPQYFAYVPPLLEGVTVRLAEMPDGDYTIAWYDPQAGSWQDSTPATARGGSLTFVLPAFRRDLAARVVPQP